MQLHTVAATLPPIYCLATTHIILTLFEWVIPGWLFQTNFKSSTNNSRSWGTCARRMPMRRAHRHPEGSHQGYKGCRVPAWDQLSCSIQRTPPKHWRFLGLKHSKMITNWSSATVGLCDPSFGTGMEECGVNFQYCKLLKCLLLWINNFNLLCF